MKSTAKPKILFLIVMCLFGCLGPVIKAIGLPSPVTACIRAWLCAITLIAYILLSRHPYDKAALKKIALPLILSGICLAGDWIGLFESYNHTTVATATVCYYLAPIFVMIATPFFLKEKLTVKHYICIAVAFVGIALISGIVENGLPKMEDILGVVLAIVGAVFYAVIILINKKYMKDADPMITTAVQMAVTSVITLPYILLTQNVGELHFSGLSVLLLLFLGIVMTAIAYIFYFGNIVKIPTQTAALFSYADPTVAVIISVVFMHESITVYGIIGAVLVIGAAAVSEIDFKRGKNER